MSTPQIVMSGLSNPELTSRLKDSTQSSQQTLGIIDVATKLKELQQQHVEVGKQLMQDRFEPCVVCGDRASGEPSHSQRSPDWSKVQHSVSP